MFMLLLLKRRPFCPIFRSLMMYVIWLIKIVTLFRLKWYNDSLYFTLVADSNFSLIVLNYFEFLEYRQVETLRLSKNEIVKVMFTNQLSKTGNLTVAYDQPTPMKNIADQKSKWGAALMAEKRTARVNKCHLLFAF